MKIVRLNGSNAEYFYGLDPFSILDPLSGQDWNRSFALGAVEEGTVDTPVGLIVCESREDMLLIRWLYVDPEKRGLGYGDALLSDALDAAVAGGKRSVAAVFGQEPERAMLCSMSKEYFTINGFDREEILDDSEGPDLILDLDPLSSRLEIFTDLW